MFLVGGEIFDSEKESGMILSEYTEQRLVIASSKKEAKEKFIKHFTKEYKKTETRVEEVSVYDTIN